MITNENCLGISENCFVTYDNYSVWTSRVSDIFEKIKSLNPGLQINHSNYREIFSHLDDYLKIDDVILNTASHPFLFEEILGAKNLPNHNFTVIFNDLLVSDDLWNFDLCDSDNNCEIREIRKEIFGGLQKFFEKAGNDLGKAMSEKFSDYKDNFHFVSYEKTLDKVLEKFIEFNKDEKDSSELTEKFKEVIEKYKNFEYGGYAMSLAFKLDLAKFFSIFDSNNNVFAHDFDQIKYFDIQIDQEFKNFPKFYLAKIDYLNGKPYHPLICGFGLNFLPKELEKLYLVFFEHTIDHFQDKFVNLNILGNIIYTETRLQILFEYLSSKNFQTNEEIKNFIDETDYQDLYKDFDNSYKAFINKESIKDFTDDYEKVHFSKEPIEKMHLIDKETGQPLHHFWFDHSTEEYKNSSTWAKSKKESESLSEKNDIFKQISGGLSFI